MIKNDLQLFIQRADLHKTIIVYITALTISAICFSILAAILNSFGLSETTIYPIALACSTVILTIILWQKVDWKSQQVTQKKQNLVSGKTQSKELVPSLITSNTANLSLQLFREYARQLSSAQALGQTLSWEKMEAGILLDLVTLQHSQAVSLPMSDISTITSTLLEMIVPWRREHSKTMALLKQQEKLAQIELLKAETLEKLARAQKLKNEAELNKEQMIKLRSEAEKMLSLNEQLRFELHKHRVELALNMALNMIEKLSPDLKNTAMIEDFALKLLEPLTILTESHLAISEIDEESSETAEPDDGNDIITP